MADGDRTCPGCEGETKSTPRASLSTSPQAAGLSPAFVGAVNLGSLSPSQIEGVRSALADMGALPVSDSYAPPLSVQPSTEPTRPTQLDMALPQPRTFVTPADLPTRRPSPPAPPRMIFLADATLDVRGASHMSARAFDILDGRTLGELGILTGGIGQDPKAKVPCDCTPTETKGTINDPIPYTLDTKGNLTNLGLQLEGTVH